jgi:uncharacterized LabA/DUF88 family protein
MHDKKQRVIFYIDGFNFYFGLKTKKWRKYYWLDMVALCSSFLRPHQELIEVNYFSAIPTNDTGRADRQDLFFSANKLNPKFHLHLGKFLPKNMTHRECGKVITTFEEKETDVRIATSMIRDVVLDRCDMSILVSADSDLIPPLEFIKEYDPLHKLVVYFPPNRSSWELPKKTNSSLKLENHESRFIAAMLPETIQHPNGFLLKRPKHWK